MANTTALDTLLVLSSREADSAAELLGKAIAQRDDAQQRLAMLTRLREEYAQKLQRSAHDGLSFSSYRNFQMFMEKIDVAIAGQQQIEAGASARADRAQHEWQQRKHEGKTWELLLQRAQSAAALKEARVEHKLMDEFAARASANAARDA